MPPSRQRCHVLVIALGPQDTVLQRQRLVDRGQLFQVRFQLGELGA
jgi:hypothetical protein